MSTRPSYASSFLLVLFAMLISSAAVRADSPTTCGSAPTPEQHIVACTAVIEGGASNPDDIVAAYLNRGLAYFATQRLAEAIADFDKGIELAPKDDEIFLARVIALSVEKNYDRAIQDDNQALRLNGYSVRAYNNRANNYRAKGELQLAVEDYSSAIKLDGKEPTLYFNRGNGLKALGKFADAIRDFDRTLDLNKNFSSAYISRGNTYEVLGDFAHARQDFERALQIDPMNPAALTSSLALARLADHN